MKVKFLHLSILLTLLGGAALKASAQAQHEGLSPHELQDPNHSELNLNDDKTLLFDQESKARMTSRDSLVGHSKPSPAQNAQAPSKSKGDHSKPFGMDEDDPLSFNFLYYIIQKFKISDLIDE